MRSAFGVSVDSAAPANCSSALCELALGLATMR